MRRFICTAMPAVIFASAVCCSAAEEAGTAVSRNAEAAEVYDVCVNGTARPGYTLRADYELSDRCSSGQTVIRWYRDGSEIAGENSAEYTLKKDDAERNIKVGITPAASSGDTGEEIFSQSVCVARPLTECTARNNTNITDYTETPLTKNNPGYVFSENGYTYAYLAAEENGMYVIADDAAGRVKLAEDPKDNYFNPEDSSTIAYWLNHDYLEGMTGSGGKKINAHIVDYLREREYLTEGNGISGMAGKDDYVVKCKVALPAFYEFTEEYSDIIGYNPTGASYYMTFRTPISKNRTSCPNLKTDTGAVGVSVVTSENKNYVNITLRVCMLIGYDFFKEHKLDMNMGDEVKAFLRGKFTRSEMAQAGYTDEELAQIGYKGTDLSASDFTVSGIRAAGQMLGIDNMRELPGKLDIKYSWYYSGERDGDYRKITAANRQAYVIEKRLAGKYIKARAEIYDYETGEKYGAVENVTDAVSEAEPLTVIAEDFDVNTGTAAFAVTNNTGEETDIYFIAAAYDSENRMTGCTARTEAAAEGESRISITVGTDNAYSYRLMAWKSAESARLLCGRTVR